MIRNLTEVVFVLDESGSMCGLEKDTIGGFNSMLKKQQDGEGQVYVSTVLFSSHSHVVHDRVSIDSIKPMTDTDYSPHGCTALLDAMGDAIKHIGNVHKYAREEDRPNKTLFVITTDGEENSSHRYTYDKIKTLVERQKEKYGWEFIFLGANIDAIGVGSRFGVSEDMCVDYRCDEKGVNLNYEVLGNIVKESRKCMSMPQAHAAMQASLREIKEDYKSRKG